MTDMNLDELQKYIAKQNRLIRFQTIVQSCILVVLILFIAGAAVAFIGMESKVSRMEDKIDQVDTKALNESIVSFKKAADNLESLDTEQFNEMIDSLNSASQNLETASSAFSGWFS